VNGPGIDRQYIQTFIYADIEREIALAHAQETHPEQLAALGVQGAGNLLTALGLLCYTEYIGGLMRGGHFAKDECAANFNAAFGELGTPYRRFRQHCNVYDVFRCGLAHQYATKGDCEISMLRREAQEGIGRLPNGKFFFNVEAYYDDFKTMCERLLAAGRLDPRQQPSAGITSTAAPQVTPAKLPTIPPAVMGSFASYDADPTAKVIPVPKA
jgi:hypothetical protein